MKKFVLFAVLSLVTCCASFGAKYSVNSSGVVKSPQGSIISSPGNTVNQNFYNNYNVQTYVNTNAVNEEPTEIIEFVMDYSGSMANWITVAKRSMYTIVGQVPSSVRLGFRVFGHDNYGNNPKGATVREVSKMVKKGNKISVVTVKSYLGSTSGVCTATTQVAPIMTANASSILNGMNSVDIGGATPLVYALDRTVAQDFANFDMVTPKKIVLITDGGENCGGDPCEFARRLMSKRSDVHIDVVLVSSYSKSLSCLSSTTGGHFYNINNLSDFSTVINRSVQSNPSAPAIQTNSEIQNENDQKYEYINDTDFEQ